MSRPPADFHRSLIWTSFGPVTTNSENWRARWGYAFGFLRKPGDHTEVGRCTFISYAPPTFSAQIIFMGSVAPLLRVVKVSKRFGSPGGVGEIAVLDEVSFELAPGETLAIVGPSGSGKSTLLHVIGTLDQPTSDEVFLEDQNLNQL